MSNSVILEIAFHDDDYGPPWAEWDLFEDGGVRFGSGTAPSFESAIDAAVNAWKARFHDAPATYRSQT